MYISHVRYVSNDAISDNNRQFSFVLVELCYIFPDYEHGIKDGFVEEWNL